LGCLLDDLEVRPIRITYRHSKQLNELARRIAMLSNSEIEEAQLPPQTDNDQVKPVLGRHLETLEALAIWLRRRIVEIERLSGRQQSIAVLVNSEEEVSLVAAALDAALRTANRRAVVCREGRVIDDRDQDAETVLAALRMTSRSTSGFDNMGT
jgi:hypothetical protein